MNLIFFKLLTLIFIMNFSKYSLIVDYYKPKNSNITVKPRNHKLQNTVALIILGLLVVVGFSMVTRVEKVEQSQINTILANN